jgi:tetratricopeptide (TPR) repeat protein
LQRACELEPTNDQYLFHLGRAHYLKDDMEGALAHLGKAVELNPKFVGAWKALGKAQVDSGLTEAGRDSYLRALESNPGDAGAHFLLAQALEVLGDLPAARAAYEKSIELDPSVYEVHGRLAQVCGKLGDSEGEAKAQAGMQQWMAYNERFKRRLDAVNERPGDAVAVRRMGEMYYEIGQWEKALDLFLRAIHIDTRDWRAHLYSGVARRHLKDYVYSMHHLREAEFFAPDVLDPKLELMRLYKESGDEAALRKLLDTTELEASEDGDSLYFMAEVCREIGLEEDAKRLFEKAARLGVTETPADPDVVEDDAGGDDAAGDDAAGDQE